MNGIFRITAVQMEDLIRTHLDLPEESVRTLVTSGEVSATLLVGLHKGKLIGFFGIVPQTLLSDTGYIWLYNTTLSPNYRAVFARIARKVIQNSLDTYITLFGDCKTESAAKFLRWLGAKVYPTGKFIIQRPT